jgi:hypothetical protein
MTEGQNGPWRNLPVSSGISAVSVEEKQATIPLLEMEGEEELKKRAQIDLLSIDKKNLSDFVKKNTRSNVDILHLYQDFLYENSASWATNSTCVTAEVNTNDTAERKAWH